MVSYPRAEIATVIIGYFEFECLMLPDGTFGIAVPQICNVFSFLNKNAQRDIQSLLNEHSPFLKWSSKLNSKAVNVLLLPRKSINQKSLRFLTSSGVKTPELILIASELASI
jgi:hypothetical protein